VRTPVRVVRGPCRGRSGDIAGALEDRTARGITRAIVRFENGDAELLETCCLETESQLELWRDPVRG
jgi:hypothetical protein